MKAARLHLLSEEKRLLWHLRTQGPMPRTELALALQVSNSALTKLSHKLLSLGLVDELASAAPARGRPTVPLSIAPGGGFAAGATVHKGVLEIAFVDFSGGVISLTSEQVGAPGPAEFAAILERRIHELCVRYRLLGMRFLGIGVGVPGPSVSREGERWHVVKELPGWSDVPLGAMLDDALGTRVWLENDAKAAALAEYYLNGTIRTSSTVVVILLGYGIGAGVIEDGRLVKGEFGRAGDVGRLYPVDAPRPTTMDLLALLRDSGCRIDSVADMEAAAAARADVVDAWLERAAAQLAPLVDSALAWFDPADIVFSSPLPPSITARLAARLNARGPRGAGAAAPVAVRVSTLGGSAIALGAALLPIHAATAL